MSATRPCATTSKPAALLIATPATAAPRAGVNALVVPSAAATTRIWERPFFIFLQLMRFRVLKRFVPCDGAVGMSCSAAAVAAASARRAQWVGVLACIPSRRQVAKQKRPEVALRSRPGARGEAQRGRRRVKKEGSLKNGFFQPHLVAPSRTL